jgi:hypothetical protein
MLRFFGCANRERSRQAKGNTHSVYVYFLLLIHFFTTPNVDRGKTIQRPIARSFNSDFFLLFSLSISFIRFLLVLLLVRCAFGITHTHSRGGVVFKTLYCIFYY